MPACVCAIKRLSINVMEISIIPNICKTVKGSGSDGIQFQPTDDATSKTTVYMHLKTEMIFKRLIILFSVTISNKSPVFHLFRLFKARLDRNLSS